MAKQKPSKPVAPEPVGSDPFGIALRPCCADGLKLKTGDKFPIGSQPGQISTGTFESMQSVQPPLAVNWSREAEQASAENSPDPDTANDSSQPAASDPPSPEVSE